MRRDVFQAIADPVRRDIIGLLAQEQLNLNAIASRFEISRPAISRHIKILKECGLIEIENRGRERYCQIQPQKLTEVATWIAQFRQLWEEKLDSFEAYLEELKLKRSEDQDASTLEQ